MSFFDRITKIEEGMGQNLSTQIHGDEKEAGALAKGNGNSFYAKTQSKHPKALMVRPAGATWDYNPVPVRPDVNHGEVGGKRIDDSHKLPTEDTDTPDLDSILEGINEIEDSLFG